ncbi:MAG: hypothetical protein IJM53_01030 [Lachnospiraceae bacterium]|nr:hypothetical protein [Lachnospiraceae bacterium]
MDNQHAMPKGYGFRGWMLILYQALCYVGYVMTTSYVVNILSAYCPNGTMDTTLLTMIGTALTFVVTYFIIAPRIGKIRNQKAVSLLLGIITLVLAAGEILIFPTTAAGGLNPIWIIFFCLTHVIAPTWANSMTTILIGNWFPRKKGTVMGIVTIAYPITSAILLSVFQATHAGQMAMGKPLITANIIAWAPFFAAVIIGLIICAIFVKTYPEDCGCYRDNDKSFTKEMADAMLQRELEARKRSVWKRSKIWACAQWYLGSIPTTLIVTSSVAFMVQIIPALASFAMQGHFTQFVVPGFFFMSNPISAVLFLMGIFAIIGSYVLGLLDTRFGTKPAIIITAISIIIMGVLGMFNNPWTLFVATMLLGVYMGAGSNFGFSLLVRYWRPEDFPAVYTGAPPINSVVNAVLPYIFAALATTAWGYHATFAFVGVLGVISLIMEAAFSPKKLADYDNKLRVAAGLEADNVLYDRIGMEKRLANAKKDKLA